MNAQELAELDLAVAKAEGIILENGLLPAIRGCVNVFDEMILEQQREPLDCHRCYSEAGRHCGFMLLCPICGCKRCPRASDHRLACTGSNERGQPGSVYA